MANGEALFTALAHTVSPRRSKVGTYATPIYYRTPGIALHRSSSVMDTGTWFLRPFSHDVKVCAMGLALLMISISWVVEVLTIMRRKRSLKSDNSIMKIEPENYGAKSAVSAIRGFW